MCKEVCWRQPFMLYRLAVTAAVYNEAALPCCITHTSQHSRRERGPATCMALKCTNSCPPAPPNSNFNWEGVVWNRLVQKTYMHVNQQARASPSKSSGPETHTPGQVVLCQGIPLTQPLAAFP